MLARYTIVERSCARHIAAPQHLTRALARGYRASLTTTKFLLTESDIPERWYNVVSDMPNRPMPPLNPATHEPIGPEALAPLFPMALIEQEVSTEPWIEIPEQVRDIYQQWRPRPLFRAHSLEKALDTPAHIYYKYEGGSPSGSHKPNTAILQALHNDFDGALRLMDSFVFGPGATDEPLAFSSLQRRLCVQSGGCTEFGEPIPHALAVKPATRQLTWIKRKSTPAHVRRGARSKRLAIGGRGARASQSGQRRS